MDFEAQPLWPLEIPAGRSVRAPSIGIVAGVALGFGVLSFAGRLMAHNSQNLGTIFGADGVLTAFLICQPRERWRWFLLPAWLADAASILLFGGTWTQSAFLAFCNILEVFLAAWLVRRSLLRKRDLASPAMMIRFLLFAILLAPAVAGALACLYYHLAFGSRFLHVFGKWFPAYALGMAVMAPMTLCVRHPEIKHLFSRTRWFRTVAVLLLVLALSLAVFSFPQEPLRFLWLPVLMLVVFEAGIPGATIGTFEICIVGAVYTLDGVGPLWMRFGANLRESVLFLQIAVFALAVSIVPFAAAFERQRRLRARFRIGMKRYRLLADHSRDIVVLANLRGRRLYASPAVQDVLGWTPEQWAGQDAAEFMHREDREAFQRMLAEMTRGVDRRRFCYRTRHKNGHYVWMEASLRLLPDEKTGEPNAFVANIRDISERVDAGKRLAEAHLQLQRQAERDSLTQLANRRRFDDVLEKEWRRCRRTGNPLALLLVDIDHFKRINDGYGHRAGDRCLQEMAAILRQTARRPSDLAARYGGEEFAILLPDVGLYDATIVADALCVKVREHLFDAGIERPLSLTVSVGVGSRIPAKDARAGSLIEAADRALYAAKLAGRDRAIPEFEEAPAACANPVE